MQPVVKKTPLAKKQIPTILGLGVLLISLVAGLLMFGDGTGVFAPRATPQTTPKNVKVTNLTDKSFTVVFYTDESTNGFIKYGTSEDSMKTQSSDDRDQLSGSIGNYRLHHVTVRGLTPNTSYKFVLGTASGSSFDNSGIPFSTKTYSTPSGAPPTNKTVYGTVSTEAGAPAEGSVVFVKADGVAEMSTLIKSSGSWALALSNARKQDGSGYAELTDQSLLNIVVQGVEPNKVSSFTSLVSASQPVAEVVLGQVPVVQEASASAMVEEAVLPQTPEQLADKLVTSADDDASAQSLADLAAFVDLPAITTGAATATDEATNLTASVENTSMAVAEEVLDLVQTQEADRPVLVTQPIIKGKAAPNVVVTIEVHSDEVINQTVSADAAGDFVLNIIELQRTLSPGENTVTYTYTDPLTNQAVTKTQTFMVQTTDAFAENVSPFGSGNPYPLTSPTPAITVAPATRSAIVATDSGTYKSGSIGNTLVLVIGGLFFMFTGAWSWWLAHEVSAHTDEE